MNHSFLDALLFSISVTLPSILLLVLGWFLRRTKQVDTKFCDQSAKIVFNYALPTLIFLSIYNSETSLGEELPLIMAGVVAILTLFFGAELVARRFIQDPRDQGAFVQGIFRANMMIMGLAFVGSAYGASGLARGAIFGGALTLLLNVLAVFALNRASSSQRIQPTQMIRQMLTNPLIIGILLAILCKYAGVPVPDLVQAAGRYVAALALPLALICAGATIDFKTIVKVSDVSLWASLGRLLVAPIVSIVVGWLFGLSGESMGVLFLMTATPVAAASYVMAKAMGSNDVAAANIIGLTTVGVMPILAITLTLLRYLDWI